MSDHTPSPDIPGAPANRAPSVPEPTDPRPPQPPKPDQRGPAGVSPTGAAGQPDRANAQQGRYLTTAQGAALRDTDHSLTAGERGPTLLQDHHLREKIMHFDHERIPERAVHARGNAAHGVFRSYGTAREVTCAQFLQEDVETPVYVRFSNVVGSRGSADVVRDTRGFATKFYTQEGVYDLVGNNIPVFFIQDGIKFPDLVHAAKPRPDREVPQAQSAHDTFWDFVSLHTEAQAHAIWQMSDRGIPRSHRMMEGFGVHTFRLVDGAGGTTLAKFHWKPRLGVHSVLWEEAQLINGVDPDFHRRDLADAIEAGAFPQWELGIQVFPDTADQLFEGIDLLDPTKLVPEELAPVRPVGLMTLNANPINYFAETEQVAYHPGHLVPGIDVTDDPLLQARLFSYLDTQLNRFGGTNFAQIPINRPRTEVNSMHRDGYMQMADPTGVAPYRPNSLDGGCPFTAGADVPALIDVPRRLPASVKTRDISESFADHFGQARLFWLSLSDVEQEHTIAAYTFELGKCYEEAIKRRQLQCLANIDAVLCAGVAQGLGLPAPEPTIEQVPVSPSPALSQLGRDWPTDGRVIGLIADESSDLATVRQARDEIISGGMLALVIAPHGGTLEDGSGVPVVVQRTFLTARSTEFDAVLVTASPTPAPDAIPAVDAKARTTDPATDRAVDPRVTALLAEAFRHAKAIGGWGEAGAALSAAGCAASAPGVVVGDDSSAVTGEVVELLARHRVWNRFPIAAHTS